MTFMECALECAKNSEFVSEFDRLMGCSLSAQSHGPPIVAMIDDATGKLKHDLAVFMAFVYEVIWTRIDWAAQPPEVG